MSPLLMLATWVVAHWPQIVATAGAIATLGQAIPPSTWAKLVARYPRVAAVFRASSALGPDVVKFLRIVAEVWSRRAPASTTASNGRTDARTDSK